MTYYLLSGTLNLLAVISLDVGAYLYILFLIN